METSVPSTFSLDSRTQRCKALSRASFFPCLIPQQACDSEVQRLGENEADSRRVEALFGVIACPAIYILLPGGTPAGELASRLPKLRSKFGGHGHGGHQRRHRHLLWWRIASASS